MPEMMPPADLEPRDSDVPLLPDQFKELSFFAQLKKVPDLKKFPGTLTLRFFRKGEVICRQGESGWSAFSILSDQDALKALQLYRASGAPGDSKGALDKEIARLQGRQASAEEEAASVFLAIPRRQKPRPQGWLGWLNGLFSGSAPTTPKRPLYIPIDGPTNIPYDSRQASLRDGDLFGEMSSLYGTPRSATVVASRDLYVLEVLRNILDEVKRDDGFRKRMNDVYKSRVLQMHLSELAIFRDVELTPAQLDQLREEVELLRFKDGDVICDENDRSDSLYIIRGGLVKVMKNTSALLGVDDVKDWSKLSVLLSSAHKPEAPAPGPTGPAGSTDPGAGASGLWAEGSQAGTSDPRSVLWELLSPAVQSLLVREPAALSPEDRQEVVHGLNELIKKRDLPDLKDLQPLAGSPRLTAERPAKKPAEWPERELRPFNRLLLEEALPDALHGLKHGKGPSSILAFEGPGEFFGEMGLLLRKPRSASCVAYIHPLPEGPGAQPVWLRQGDLVEMVRIPEKTFWNIVEASPAVRANVEKVLARHQQADIRRQKERTWDAPRQVQSSERFSKLGLVQGQRLMLIDLDRCTRCDECVQACVHTHTDGRSRLFLDGERFGKYLVPTTCRSCLEPVCMIGCPVGSIHRGDNRQIVIEDWCIGCGLCARNCPYGSIQMHDIRLVPGEARGWLFLPAQAVTDSSWTRPGYADAHWLIGKAPFFDDPDLERSVAVQSPGQPVGARRRAGHVLPSGVPGQPGGRPAGQGVQGGGHFD